MAKIKVRFQEIASYEVELEVPDEVATLPDHELEMWLLEGEDDCTYFTLANEQKPDWSDKYCVGIENRSFVGVVKE